MKIAPIFKFIVSIVVCHLAGFIGSIFTTPAIPTWYASLNKPSFTPPNWLFAPVWLSLFTLMGISVFLVWHKGADDSQIRIGLRLFIIQLILNAMWSVVFFGLKSPISGFIVIIILWIFILMTILNFLKISQTAGILLIPYIVWVTFAAFLNLSIFRLNL